MATEAGGGEAADAAEASSAAEDDAATDTDADEGADEGAEGDEEDVDNGPDERVGLDEQPRDKSYAASAPGRYEWDEDKRSTLPVSNESITAYSWADGEKEVSIYIQVYGLDDVADGALLCQGNTRQVSLTILGVGTPPARRHFSLGGLRGDIKGVRMVRSHGKHQVVLKLRKAEAQAWDCLTTGLPVGGGVCWDDA